MKNYTKYSSGLKFLFKDFNLPFKKLFSTLRTRWRRGLRVGSLKSGLVKDMDQIKDDLIDGSKLDMKILSKYVSRKFDKKTLRDLKIIEFFEKIEKIERGDGYDEAIELMFESFYEKLDKRLLKIVTKLETKVFNDKVEYDEESSISKSEYKKQKIELQIELVKLQEWAVANGKKIAIVFEGRDAAGKGSSIKRFIEYINPKFYRVVALGIPTKEESKNWFARYEKHLPNKGEIVFFDRSWYNRGVIEPTMDYCTEDQYQHFMENVNEWENRIMEDDIILFKFWFSVDKEKQLERFQLRKESPLKHWKYSPNDEKTISKWGVMTKYKDQMFDKTSTDKSPWVVINSNDKRVSRLNSIRYILSKIDYTGKDEEKNLEPSPEVVKVQD